MADKVVVGILYPTEWFGTPESFAAAVDQLRSLDPRLEVIVADYSESHDLRSARGKATPEEHAILRTRVPALSDPQRDLFAKIEVAMAIDLPYDVAKVAPKLKWVQAVGAGTGQLQSAGLAEAGIALTSNAGSNSVAIAEFCVGRILEEWKRFDEIRAAQQEHNWDALYGQELSDATIGLIGFGAITEAVAQRLRGFGVRILATRRTVNADTTSPYVDEFLQTADLLDMLPQCDVVVSAVPETKETTGLMNAAAFAAMKPGSFFVNVGRGSLVDEAALIAALKSGHLRGAALDVASQEPLPADNPLWDAPNLKLSAHCSSSPGALFKNLHSKFNANLQRYLAGESLTNVVDASRGY
jgi:phosphoglycerate dehydrogenase-like enzyme